MSNFNGTESLVLNGTELNALASVLEMTCNKACAEFVEGKRKKKNPIDMEKERNAVQKCLSDTHGCVAKNCSEDYNALIECMTGPHKRAWAKCKDIRRDLDKCSVKNRCGELSYIEKER